MNTSNWRTLQDAKPAEIGERALQFFDSRTTGRVVFGSTGLSFRLEATHFVVEEMSRDRSQTFDLMSNKSFCLAAAEHPNTARTCLSVVSASASTTHRALSYTWHYEVGLHLRTY